MEEHIMSICTLLSTNVLSGTLSMCVCARACCISWRSRSKSCTAEEMVCISWASVILISSLNVRSCSSTNCNICVANSLAFSTATRDETPCGTCLVCVCVCVFTYIRIYVCMSEAYLKRRTWTFWGERERKGEEGNGLCVLCGLYVSIFLALFVCTSSYLGSISKSAAPKWVRNWQHCSLCLALAWIAHQPVPDLVARFSVASLCMDISCMFTDN